MLLVALLLMFAMAALTPFAFRTHPGDYSIFGVIPLLAALTGGAALVGDWLGRRILNGAVDTAWPRQRRRTTRCFSTGGFLLVTISVLVLAAFVCLFASLSFTGHPPRRASPYLFYAEFWGIDLESVTIVHPVVLWVSRGLAVCAAALVVVLIRRRRVRLRTLAHEHDSRTAKR